MEKKSKILVVDDDERWLSTVKTILESDYDLTATSNPATAKRILLKHSYALVVLDVRMPEISGSVLLSQIRNVRPEIPVVMLTGYPDIESAVDAMKTGAVDYICKGTRDLAPTLRNKVDEAIAHKTSHDGDTLDTMIAKSYPTPISYLHRELQSCLTPMETFFRQLDMFKAVLQFASSVLVCEFLQYGALLNNGSDLRLRKRIHRPALGDWFDFAKEILKHKKQLGHLQFLDIFSTFFNGRNRDNIAKMIQIRNDDFGHSAKRSDFEYEALVTVCEELLRGLLDDFKFITTFLLCHVSSTKTGKNLFTYKLRECTGKNQHLHFSERAFKTVLPSDEMLLINLENEEFLSLHPLLVLENCTICKQREIFFYSKCSNNKAHYLSYRTGHALISEKLADDFTRLVS